MDVDDESIVVLFLHVSVDQSRWYDPNAVYDPRYRSYYDQVYNWYNYDPEAYRRADPYYGQQYPSRYELSVTKVTLVM